VVHIPPPPPPPPGSNYYPRGGAPGSGGGSAAGAAPAARSGAIPSPVTLSPSALPPVSPPVSPPALGPSASSARTGPPPPPSYAPTPGVYVSAHAVPAPSPSSPAGGASVGAAPGRTIRKYDAVVVDVVRRTHDASSVYFFLGESPAYKAGQFLTIDPHQFPELKRWIDYLEIQKGKKEPIRSYSLQSAPGEKCVAICTKAEEYNPQSHKYPPLLSPFMASGALKGREVQISGFSGAYVVDDDIEMKTDTIVHWVAGSGVVPNYGILKDELRNNKNPRIRHVMFDVNKTVADIILHDQLRALASAYSHRFTYVNLVTREDPSYLGPNYLKGRPTAELVRRYVPNPAAARHYACGAAITKHQREAARQSGQEPPPRFMESVEAILHELGVPRAHWKKEEFG
jgi:3-ketosteroid 9alpha-monooxygenase subunit B